MHEYSLIQSLVERVETEARQRAATAVHRLAVRVGALSGVDVELFRTAYYTFRERTICEQAELDIQVVSAEWACKSCRQPIAAGAPLRCPACARPATLVSGDELILDRIEMEVA